MMIDNISSLFDNHTSNTPRPNGARRRRISHIYLALALTTGFLSSCSDIVFATRSSLGVELTGDATPVPDHVNLGFRRREFIYAGKDAPKEKSLLGKLDSETSWREGIAVRETFATGNAAVDLAGGTPTDSEVESESGRPLTFASRTRIGFAINAGGSEDDAVPTFMFGYSRKVASRIQTRGGLDDKAHPIPSLVADVSVHTSGILSDKSDPTKSPGAILPEEFRLSQDQGRGRARIRQIFAIGKATNKITKAQKESIKKQLETPPKPSEENSQNPASIQP